jgi:tRNA U54 and U55 pseudouridine synthase Pus10
MLMFLRCCECAAACCAHNQITVVVLQYQAAVDIQSICVYVTYLQAIRHMKQADKPLPGSGEARTRYHQLGRSSSSVERSSESVVVQCSAL